MKVPFLVLILLLMAGCASNKSLYNSVQYTNSLECSKLEHEQYKECMQRTNKPYEQYERDRQSLIKE